MKMESKTYDILKFLVCRGLPALEALWLGLGAIWNLPYTEAIGATIAVIITFLGTLIGISSKKYWNEIEADTTDENGNQI